MDTSLKNALARCETDVEGALDRLDRDETLYEYCLRAFLDDPSMEDLASALSGQAWDDAFTAIHALKGVAGNMGFIPLFHESAEMVVLIRSGKMDKLNESYRRLKRCYYDVTEAIRNNCAPQKEEGHHEC